MKRKIKAKSGKSKRRKVQNSTKRWNPKFWSIDTKRPGVRRVGKWIDIKKIKTEWKNVNGVYIFANKNRIVKYVGFAGSSNLKKESLSATKQRNKAKGATIALFVQCTSNKYAKELENKLKHMYAPVNNKDI